MAPRRLVIVSNRLHITVRVDDQVLVSPASGGLATALRRYYERSSGVKEESTDICAVVNTRPNRCLRKLLARSTSNMKTQPQEPQVFGFVIGLLTGTCVGAGLAMWLAPRSASGLRQRMTDSVRRLRRRASDEYQQASTRTGETVDELTRKVQDVRDDVADAVASGAHEVERYATAAKTDRVAQTQKHSAADRSASRSHSL
jgi:gas vesicle protein